MTPTQRRERKRIEECRQVELTIIDFFRTHPDQKPDGYFVFNQWSRGYRAGVRSEKKRKEKP